MTLRGGVQKASGARALSAHQKRLRERLSGAEFRMLNEALYTRTSAEAVTLFQENNDLFRVYHDGFSAQAARWPTNPLDAVLRALRKMPATSVVADFGCGEARLAKEAGQKTIHSFDLCAANELVIPCDMAHVPLEDNTVDVAVFCLALMGTDYGGAIAEARRVLRPGGILFVAEVASRFDEQNPASFIKGVKQMGFRHLAEHAFVREAEHKSDSAKGVGKSKSARRRRAAKLAAEKKAAANEAEGTRLGSQFFFHFAFEALDKDNVTGWRRVGLPTLKPCIYKRR